MKKTILLGLALLAMSTQASAIDGGAVLGGAIEGARVLRLAPKWEAATVPLLAVPSVAEPVRPSVPSKGRNPLPRRCAQGVMITMITMSIMITAVTWGSTRTRTSTNTVTTIKKDNADEISGFDWLVAVVSLHCGWTRAK
jgi:hypothetical protein